MTSRHRFISRKKKPVFRKTKMLTMSQDIGDMIDDISNLPDCILHHILSFIPTKEVVKTSILSTRWKNLWTFVPKIDFDDEMPYAKMAASRCQSEVASFIKFVEGFLRLRGHSNMEKFRVSCFVCNNASQIHSWISYAIMHNVQELDIYLFGDDPSVIPKSIFDSTSLVTLKIRMDCVLELPCHLSFPCLNTLHLSLVRIPNDDFTEKLFSSCPVLEELALLDCDLDINLKNIVISSSTLKSLTIHDHSYFRAFGILRSSIFMIDAPNVTYFEYFGNLSNEIFFINDSSLVKACIHIPTPRERETVVASRAADLLKRLRYIVSFRISNFIMESLIFADNTVHHSPLFVNLSHLALIMENVNYPFGGLMDLLYFCPVLQSICLSEGFEHPMPLGESDPIWLLVPICMSNCLKTVTFKKFHANDSEVYFLKCILKYARVLERMDIWWSKTRLPGLKKQAQAKTGLQTIERSSTTGVVKFS